MNKQNTNKDELKALLDEKVAALTTACVANKVPVAVIYAINGSEGTETISSILTPSKLGVDLTVDKISPLIALVGTDKFRVVPIRERVVYDEETYYPADDVYPEE